MKIGRDKEGQGKNTTRSFKVYSRRPKGQGKAKGILEWQKGMTVAEFKESGDMWPGGINKKKFFSNIKGRGKGE